jgi:hypothetical protein
MSTVPMELTREDVVSDVRESEKERERERERERE